MIQKSSRHSKIIGDFGEQLIINWLSRSGFEVVLVDHTGIDIIAFNKRITKRIGITVKSRTRNEGAEEDAVTIFHNDNNERQKFSDACEAFACDPWFGVYVETLQFANLYLLSLEHYDKKYRLNPMNKTDNWKMKEKNQLEYEEDPDIKHIKIEFIPNHWKWDL
jgi:Holliday junction resolvase-like predicted endonuclease